MKIEKILMTISFNEKELKILKDISKRTISLPLVLSFREIPQYLKPGVSNFSMEEYSKFFDDLNNLINEEEK